MSQEYRSAFPGAIGKSVNCVTPKYVLWNTATDTIKDFPASDELRPYVDLAPSPDGRTLASLINDGKKITVTLVDVVSGKEMRELKTSAEDPFRIAFVAENRIALVGTSYNARPSAHKLYEIDVNTGKETVRPLPLPHPAYPWYSGYPSLAVSPDGRTIALTEPYENKREQHPYVTWVDLPSGGVKHIKLPHSRYCSLAISPDGKTLAVASGVGWRSDLTVADVTTGKIIQQKLAPSVVNCLTYSPDGKTLLLGTGTRVHRWDIAKGTEIEPPVGHVEPVRSVAYSPDGKTIASLDHSGSVRVWDVGNGKHVRSLGHQGGQPHGVTFSPDGTRILAYGRYDAPSPLRQGAVFWRVSDGKQEGTAESNHGDFVYSPDGSLLAIISADNAISLLDTATLRTLRTLQGHKKYVDGLAFSPQGRLLASTGSDGKLRLWRVPSGRLLREINVGTAHIWSVTFSPDGLLMLTRSNGELRLWDTWTGQRLREWPIPERQKYEGHFTADGRGLLILDVGERVELNDLATDKPVRELTKGDGGPTCLAVEPTGRTLAVGYRSGTLLVWSAPELLSLPPLQRAPLTEKQRESLWDALSGDDAKAAFAARWQLAADKGAVALFRERLRPVAPVEAEQVARQISALDSAKFADREQASRQLEAWDELAEEAMRKALAQMPSPEAKRRLELLLDRLEGQLISKETLRALRGVAVLAAVADEESRAVLRTLADGAPGAPVTAAARAALAPRQ